MCNFMNTHTHRYTHKISQIEGRNNSPYAKFDPSLPCLLFARVETVVLLVEVFQEGVAHLKEGGDGGWGR